MKRLRRAAGILAAAVAGGVVYVLGAAVALAIIAAVAYAARFGWEAAR